MQTSKCMQMCTTKHCAQVWAHMSEQTFISALLLHVHSLSQTGISCNICFFFIHMSIMWICVMSQACLSGRPASELTGSLVWQKLLCWMLHTYFSTTFFHTCHAYRHHWLLPFYTTFTDLDFGWGSQGWCKAKPQGFVFIFKFDLVLKQFRVNILTLFWMISSETREITAVWLCQKALI